MMKLPRAIEPHFPHYPHFPHRGVTGGALSYDKVVSLLVMASEPLAFGATSASASREFDSCAALDVAKVTPQLVFALQRFPIACGTA